MMDRRKRTKDSSFIPEANRKKTKSGELDFSWHGTKEVANFGFGFGSVANTYTTTEEVRVALDLAFKSQDVAGIRAISQHFFKVSGVYSRAARYLAYLPTYDYLINPRVLGLEVAETTIIREVISQLTFLEKMKLKNTLGTIALDVIVEGVYYAYTRRNGENAVIQKLPVKACRTGKVVNGFPVVEFSLDYINGIADNTTRINFLNTMPAEIVREWNVFREDKRNGVRTEESTSERRQVNNGTNYGNWITLNPKYATAFYYNPSLQPLLANSFFAILDLMELKGIEKKKAENELFNLVVQKFPLNDDGEPVFDFVEMQAFHDSAKKIFEKSDQTDLLTTFGEINNIDLNEASRDPLDYKQWKTDIYGELGISPQLFSTEGNMALEKSIQADEALIFFLVQKFQDWITYQLEVQFEERMSSEKFSISFWIPPITVMNRKEFASTYKDMATLGYSKFLPALAMGQSQLDIIAGATFENDILGIGNIMKPLQSSHTTASGGSGGSGGRPPLPDSEKSEKTIQNMGG